VFFLVNATYTALIWDLIDRTPGTTIAPKVRRIMWIRSLTTLGCFALAAVVALKYPLAGLSICICCLIVYLKPEPPGAEGPGAESQPAAARISQDHVARMSVSDIRDNANTAPDFAIAHPGCGQLRAVVAYATSRFSRILRKSVARLP
jgi:hypothetical protein